MTHPARRRAQDRDRGFTLVELVISVVLSGILAGVVVAVLITSMNVATTTSDVSRGATDIGLIATFLYRDAQAAGGTDPVTRAAVPGLGVSVDDWGGCEQAGALVVRFSWIDRPEATAEVAMTASWSLTDTGQLVRRVCQSGVSTDVPLGEFVASAAASCTPGPLCETDTTGVELVVVGSSGTAPLTSTLNASLRSRVASALDVVGPSSPLVLVGQDSAAGCAWLGVSGGRAVVLGDALVDDACGDSATVTAGAAFDVTGAASFTSDINDPYATGLPDASSCAAAADPALGSSPDPDATMVHTAPVTVTGAVVLQPGRYVFCQGLRVADGASLTGAGVFLQVVGGDVSVAAGANVDLSARTAGSLANVLLSVSHGSLRIAGGARPDVLRGIVHVPAGDVEVSGDTSVAIGALVAQRFAASGPGAARIGLPIPEVTVEPIGLAPGQVGAVYPSVEMLADEGAAPYTWRASGLPAGLSLSTGGLLTGTPTTAGDATITFTATDATGLATVVQRTITVKPPLTIATRSLPSAQVGLAYSTAIAAGGGTTPYSFAATGLPAGLTMSPSGAVTGTPTASGSSTVTVTVTDAIYETATWTYTLSTRAALVIVSPTTLANGTVGSTWTTTDVTASGGLEPYTFTVTGLPPGLAITTAGRVSGTPTAAGPYRIEVTVADAAGATAARSYTVTIAAATVSVPSVASPAAMPVAEVGVAIASTTFVASGGSSPYTWSATGLPAGLALSSAGLLTGSPTTAGTSDVVVSVADAAGTAVTRTYRIVVEERPTVSAPATLPVGQERVAYPTTTMSVIGGIAPFAWSATGLPTGLAISPAGVVSGTPTAATLNGPVSVTVTVTDALGVTASKVYAVAVATFDVPAGCPLDPTGWRGEYYPNRSLSGRPSLCRDDAVIDFAWNGASPGGSIAGTDFSVRWTRRQSFAAGTYEFRKQSDDGMRVYIDGVLLIDDWVDQSYQQGLRVAYADLTAGFHTIVAEYYQGPGYAEVELAISSVARRACARDGVAGWLGEYYPNRTFSGAPALCRDDAAINFNWSAQAPAAGLPSDQFSVRWTRTVGFDRSGTYRFVAGSDDGVRVYVDGVKVLEYWSDRSYGTTTANVALSAGQHTIVYEFYERYGDARATLTWTRL